MAPFTEMSFDIEVFPSENIFPKPEVLGNVVFQIGTSFRDRHGTENVMFHLGSCSMEPQVRTDDHFTVICYNTEKELLQAFFKYIQRKDPDFIYSYNGDKFDWSYVVTRCIQHYGIHPQISRKPGHIASVREAKFSNAALGDNEYKIVDIPGRCSIDVLVVVQRGMEQFSDYKLETVAQSILGKGKDDIDVGDMIRAFRSRDPKQLRTVAEYCMQDTYLVQELVDKMDVLTQLTEMSNITYVPITYLLQRGQQIKVYSQIARKAKMSGFAVPTVTPDRDPTVSFTGATVLEPTVGAYYTPVAVLDFASLYPTIMMAYNVCYTTIVLPDVGVPRGKTVDEIRWTEPDGTEKSYEYVQDTESVVPALQRELFASRKRVKAMIRETNDPLRKRILKGRELAIKVSMNSIYGFTSANMLYMQCLSASVTAVGRRMINQTKHFMENEFGPGIYLNDLNLKVIGGDTDSVFIHFPNSTIEVAMHLANIAANQLTTTIFNRAPIKMEYEKVYCPYVLQAKKNYVGRMYTNDPDKPDKIDFKGIAVKRRNYCPLLKTVFWNIIQEVMDKERTVGARGGIELLKSTLKRLEDNTVPLGELAITNKLAKEYSGNAKIPHVELAKRMQQRDPGSAPVPGERFAYVFVDRPGTKDTHERAESLDFAVKHNMRPDLLYYIDHIRKPLDTFYKVLG
ncbi:DNA polymerase family B-domain-containing protein, partial [Polychytrium aggregatum]|uniref:DNA polymerase family B-domain-containing protein n=1 Tax=Polychytrium aggregatum TaxID=110093 RepID=UPI0022FDCF43